MRERDGDVEGLVDQERDVRGGGERMGADCEDKRRTAGKGEIRLLSKLSIRD